MPYIKDIISYKMERLDKTSEPYLDGHYDTLFDAAESSGIVADEVVLYSQSLERLQSYQAGVDYAAEQSLKSGVEIGRDEGMEEARIQIARNLLASGMSPEMIASNTGLSISRIEGLLKKE